MLERGTPLYIIGAGRPGEVMDIFLGIMMRGRPVGLVPAIALGSGRADGPSSRNGQADVVGSEVGKKFGRCVELMTVPSGVLEHADLGEPLRDKKEISDRAGARERSRHVGRPGNLNVHRLAW